VHPAKTAAYPRRRTTMIYALMQTAQAAQDLEAKGFLRRVGKATLGIIVVILLFGVLIGFLLGRMFRPAESRATGNRHGENVPRPRVGPGSDSELCAVRTTSRRG